jgi:hypothetical protein
MKTIQILALALVACWSGLNAMNNQKDNGKNQFCIFWHKNYDPKGETRKQRWHYYSNKKPYTKNVFINPYLINCNFTAKPELNNSYLKKISINNLLCTPTVTQQVINQETFKIILAQIGIIFAQHKHLPVPDDLLNVASRIGKTKHQK